MPGINASWNKLKRTTKRYNYAGPTASIRIAKGIRYRLGSIAIQPIKEDYLLTEDIGVFYITNIKIGFIGEKKHFSVNLNKVFSIDLSENGLRIFKEGRENPFMLFLEDYQVPLCIMSFLLNRSDNI